jgi:hypothetical protein
MNKFLVLVNSIKVLKFGHLKVINKKFTCCLSMTGIRVLIYGKALSVVSIVFRLYCSFNEPCALPSSVKGVE